MTREEALSLLEKHNDSDVADVKTIKQFINQIYDNFKSRICINCKYDLETRQCRMDVFRPCKKDHTFGCNRFKQKGRINEL